MFLDFGVLNSVYLGVGYLDSGITGVGSGGIDSVFVGVLTQSLHIFILFYRDTLVVGVQVLDRLLYGQYLLSALV